MAEASLQSIGALEILESAMKRCVNVAGSEIERINSRMLRRLESLAQAEAYAEVEVERGREALSVADENDRDQVAGHCDEMEAQLDAIRRQKQRVSGLFEEYQRQASRFSGVVGNEVRRGLVELDRVLVLVRDYHSINLEGVPESDGGSGWTAHTPAAPAAPSSSLEPVLPSGFHWVRLDEIEASELDDVRTETDFKKISRQDMQSGLELLKSELLPFLSNYRGQDIKQALFAEDRRMGRRPPVALLEVYNAFFGAQDYVYVTRGRKDCKFRVTNGRHRVRVAQELGWPAIPAQVKDLRSHA